MNKNYRIISHTADVGIEVWASSSAELFEKAGAAFCDLICDQNTLDQKLTRHIHIEKKSLEELLHDFLNELLFMFDVSHELFPFVLVEIKNHFQLKAILKGDKLDRTRHLIKLGIKAVTFHELKVWQENKIWKARVIFDV